MSILPKKIKSGLLRVKWWLVTFALILILVPAGFFGFYFGKIYPNIYLADIKVGGKTPVDTITTTQEEVKTAEKLILVANTQEGEETFEIPLESINFSYDHLNSADNAYRVGRTGNPLFDAKTIFQLLTNGKTLGLRFNINEEILTEHLATIAGQVTIDPIFPSASLIDKKVVIESGKTGVDIDTNALRINIGQNLAFAKEPLVTITTKTVDPTLTEQQLENLRQRAEMLMDKSLSLNFEFESFTYGSGELLEFLDPYNGISEDKLVEVSASLAKAVNREPQNAKFEFSSGKVAEFAPAKDGIELNSDQLRQEITEGLAKLESGENKQLALQIPVQSTPPEVQTADVNDLGIKELIGRGTSQYKGSISSRIFNIDLAASRLNGTLVAPGDVLSFNQAVGDISKFSGYKEAFIIQDGKTVLGDGGGVCQVSTTLFRAALDTGLPIVERRAHSYRVGYYEQDSLPGLDATIYSPTTDLKLENDTPGHILVQATADTKNRTLVFEFYGTNDGREVTLTKPTVSNLVEPPEPLYTDDPNLPTGQVKQIDFAAWGAKTNFFYKVTKDEKTSYSKTFYSNFRPWQAKFLRGTGPIN